MSRAQPWRSMDGPEERAYLLSPAFRPIRVFLVEDSAAIRERLNEGVASEGRIDVVGFAETEADAIAALNELDCDAVVLDLVLRHGNGIEVLKSVRARHPGARPLVVVFTNYVYAHYRNQCARLGADYFFDKARDFDRVREVIEDLILPKT